MHMEFTTLTEKEFMAFVNKQDTKNFFQTAMMKERIEKSGLAVYLVGVKEKGRVIGASLLAETGASFLGKKNYEAYKGFILDYKNQELVAFMTKKIAQFLKDKGALRFFIDPYIVYVSRNREGEITTGVDNQDVFSYLKQIGYKENKQGAQVKWCYALDIEGKSSETLFNEMQQNTRNCINKTIYKYKLEIEDLSYDDLPLFKKITEDTSDRRHFADKSLQYYQEMYKSFKEDVVFKVVFLNCDTFINTTKEEIQEIKEKIGKLSTSPSNDKKRKNLEGDIANFEKRIKEVELLKKEKGNRIPLSCGMFMLYGEEIVYLFSGSYIEYMHFFGQYRIQWEIIKYAADHHYKRYNFYGIQDITKVENKQDGVYKFKKGFGGYVLELLGSFSYSVSPLCSFYDVLKKIKRLGRK